MGLSSVGTAPVEGAFLDSDSVHSMSSHSITSKTKGKKNSNDIIRSVKLLLLPDEITEQKLAKLCDISAKAYNEINYERRQQFFNNKKVDLKETYKKYYEKYKQIIGAATIQQILNRNNEDWKSFFALLKAKKGNKKLPSFIKVSPPGYKKENGKRTLTTFIRNDQYKINDDNNTLHIHGLGEIGNILVKFQGDIHVNGKQGMMQIFYDHVEKKWFAIINFHVVEKKIRGLWFKIPLAPKGDLVAGIDIGINNLYAVYIEDGRTMLINGRPLKAIAHYWREKISMYQSILNKRGYKTSKRLVRMFRRWYNQVKQYINAVTRDLVETLHEIGVSRIYVGYPKNISQDKGNFNITNVWMYRYVLDRLKFTAEEYGIEVIEVDEHGTSSTCPIHDKKDGKRIKRGLFKCFQLNKVFNADLVGAFNILKRGLSITPSPLGRGNWPLAGPRGAFLTPNLFALSGGNFAL